MGGHGYSTLRPDFQVFMTLYRNIGVPRRAFYGVAAELPFVLHCIVQSSRVVRLRTNDVRAKCERNLTLRGARAG